VIATEIVLFGCQKLKKIKIDATTDEQSVECIDIELRAEYYIIMRGCTKTLNRPCVYISVFSKSYDVYNV